MGEEMEAVEDGIGGDKRQRLREWMLTVTLKLIHTHSVIYNILTLAWTLKLIHTLTLILTLILTGTVSWMTIGMCLTGLGDIVWVWAGPHSLAVHTAHHRAESECVVLQRGIEMCCCAQMDEEVSVAFHWCYEVPQKVTWQWWHSGDDWRCKLLCGEL